MTTPAKPERPERMTAKEFEYLDSCIPPDSVYALQQEREVLLDELRRARAHEEDGWTLAEALAHEVGVQIEARLEAEREWGAAVRHHGDVMRELATTLGLAPDEKFDDGAARVVAERDDLSRANANLHHECNLSIEAHHNATAERDEARADVARMQAERDEAVHEQGRLVQERDAAREEAERLRGLLADVAQKAHDFDQQGPAYDNRFAEVEALATDAPKEKPDAK